MLGPEKERPCPHGSHIPYPWAAGVDLEDRHAALSDPYSLTHKASRGGLWWPCSRTASPQIPTSLTQQSQLCQKSQIRVEKRTSEEVLPQSSWCPLPELGTRSLKFFKLSRNLHVKCSGSCQPQAEHTAVTAPEPHLPWACPVLPTLLGRVSLPSRWSSPSTEARTCPGLQAGRWQGWNLGPAWVMPEVCFIGCYGLQAVTSFLPVHSV